MARPLRVQYEDAYYHVTCRGNARQEIYARDSDRSTFLDLLKRSSEIYQVEVLGYVLMENHFHMLLKTPLANLQEFMRQFNISYTAYYNRMYNKSGHLYQGRYKAFLIDGDHYLQEVSRYIHLNPVRVKRKSTWSERDKRKYLVGYRWSSYSSYISARRRLKLLKVGEILGNFGGDTVWGRKNYRGFVEEGLGKEIKSPLEMGRGHGIVGDEEFVGRIKDRFLRKTVRDREVPAIRKVIRQVAPPRILNAVSKVTGVGRKELMRRGLRQVSRGLVMEMLYRYGGLNQREVGEILGVDYSAVSVGRKRFRELVRRDKGLLRIMDEIKKALSQE